MGSFFHGLSMIFPRLVDHSVEISLLICLIFLVKLMISKKLPPWWHYSLWLLLLVRMLMPLEFENRLNLFNFVPAVDTPHVSELISDAPPEVEMPVQPVAMEPKAVKADLKFAAKKLIPVLWLTGAMIITVCILFESITFWQNVRRRPKVNDEAILALLSECKSRMKIKRKIDVIVTDTVRCPALFGYFKPRLLLPEGVFEKLSDRELSYAFMHELGHLKRHDIGVSWLIAVLQVIHWFNPLVWLAFYQIRIDQESACDAAVLSRMKPRQSADYAKAIVGFLEKFCQNCQLPALAGVLENRSQMKKRIARIVQYRKSSQKLLMVAFALLVTAGFALFTLTGVAAEKDSNSFSEPVVEKSKADSLRLIAENRSINTFKASDGFRDVAVSVPLDMTMESVADSEGAYGNSAMPLSVYAEAAPPDEAFSQHLVSNAGGISRQKDMERGVRSTSLPRLTADKPAAGAELDSTENGDSVSSKKPNLEPAALVKPASIEISKVAALNMQTDAPSTAAQMTPTHTQPRNEEVPVSASTVNSADGLVVAFDIKLSSTPNPKEDFSTTSSIAAAQSDKGDIPLEQNYSEAELNNYAIAAEIEMIKETGKALIKNKSAKTSMTASLKREKSVDAGALQAVAVDTPPRLVKSYPPRYPYLAKRDDITGSITLQFVVTKEGNAVETTVVESDPKGVFDEAALRAVEQYRFKPGIKDGEAVDVKVSLPIKFDLT